MWSGESALCLLIMTLGNSVGGWVFPVIRGWSAARQAAA